MRVSTIRAFHIKNPSHSFTYNLPKNGNPYGLSTLQASGVNLFKQLLLVYSPNKKTRKEFVLAAIIVVFLNRHCLSACHKHKRTISTPSFCCKPTNQVQTRMTSRYGGKSKQPPRFFGSFSAGTTFGCFCFQSLAEPERGLQWKCGCGF